MPELYPSPASTSDNQNSLNEYWPLTLTPADISATMSMSESRIPASISQYQAEAANNNLPPLARIRHFKAGLQWEITTFVMPILQYSAARNIISVVPSPIAHILHLIPSHTWNTVPDHIFLYHIYPGDPSRIVSSYDTPWWMGETAIPNEPWQWDRVMTCCIFHYQHWMALRMMVDHTSVPSVMELRWIRERLLTLLEEQCEGIHDKMAEIQIYTAILDRLKRGRGE
ncbi:uncharacterized protein EDB93DRAFT_1103001 [Suillus bovinus]|uniref:uncharacterized protein n=1 Tax=Suillus bovinus TaxID=48563 RepID=UPI001B878F68|nr:uncharacterized protein EDB93DRAFT_1103001 [Suillus bovinus]KAG2151550.1 hypothetical protein EDB93DRAFT_1103001 [Suillus bovinus]